VGVDAGGDEARGCRMPSWLMENNEGERALTGTEGSQPGRLVAAAARTACGAAGRTRFPLMRVACTSIHMAVAREVSRRYQCVGWRQSATERVCDLPRPCARREASAGAASDHQLGDRTGGWSGEPENGYEALLDG
jgi:hypothetical protein